MIPWIRDKITEAWHNRKSSRTAERRSLALSSIDTGNPESNNTMLMPLSTTSDSLSINIISFEGNVLELTVKPDYTVKKVKMIAMKHFYGHDTSKSISQYRLINSSKFKQLVDNQNISNGDVNENDELMLVEIRASAPKEKSIQEGALDGPNEETVARITSGLVVRNTPRPVPFSDCVADIQNQTDKVLITLVRAAAKILMYSPDAEKYYDIIKEKFKVNYKSTDDPTVIKIKTMFTEMSYCQEDVQKIRQLPPLISDNGSDVELTFSDKDTHAHTAGPSTSINEKNESLLGAYNELIKEGNESQKEEKNLICIVDLLLENFHHDKKLHCLPDQKLTKSLLEMGFEEKDIIEALKITGNDQANAIEWLLGEQQQNLQELDNGFDPDGLIYEALMNNPYIQLSLTNPKMLLAFLSMLKTPMSNTWSKDPELLPALVQIFKTYEAEKHAIHVNRYTTN